VSTGHQSIERQIRNITASYPTAIAIKEVYTRTKFEGRKEWQKLMAVVKEGDTIVFDEVSRMCGNEEEGCQIYKELFDKNINLVFMKNEAINTEVYRRTLDNQIKLHLQTGNNATDNFITAIIEALNSYTMELAFEQIRLAFRQAEAEVKTLRQRTVEGIETARLEGKQIGIAKGTKLTTKKSIKAKEIILKHSKEFNGTLEDEDVMKLAEVSRNTYYKYKRELKAEI
jgi:DNA invertase Pin-like site-specific DNA recombinase